MIDWLIQQQYALSLVLLALIVMEQFFTRKLGISMAYKLWALVPITLLLNNLPQRAVPIAVESYSRFIVGLSPSIEVEQTDVGLMVWALGAALLSCCIIASHVHLHLSVKATDNKQQDVYYAKAATSPMLFGLIHPKIVVPTNFSFLFNPTQQALIVEHENVHRQHADHLWNAIAIGLLVMFWFNPLVWLALRAFRVNQELACDQTVLRQKNEADKLSYAKALVQCAEHASAHNSLYPVFGGKSTLLKRLHSIKQPNPINTIIRGISVGIAALIAFSTLAGNQYSSVPISMDKVNLATPILRVEPRYPEKAIQDNLQGFVLLEFDIDEEGATDNITVVRSKPGDVFDDSAITALKQWQYKPAQKDGKRLRQHGLLVQLDYKLDKGALQPHYNDIEKIVIAQ